MKKGIILAIILGIIGSVVFFFKVIVPILNPPIYQVIILDEINPNDEQFYNGITALDEKTWQLYTSPMTSKEFKDSNPNVNKKLSKVIILKITSVKSYEWEYQTNDMEKALEYIQKLKLDYSRSSIKKG